MQERHHTFELRVVRTGTAVPILVPDVNLLLAAFEDCFTGLRRQLVPRRLHVESENVAEAGQQTSEVLRTLAHRPRRDCSVFETQVGIGNHQIRVDLLADTEAGAFRAGAVGRVEGERARFEIVDRECVAIRAGQLLGETTLTIRCIFFTVDEVEDHDAFSQAKCGLDRVGQALLRTRLDLQSVDHYFDVVLFLLLELRRIGQRMDDTVDAHSRVALGVELIEEIDELALTSTDHWCEHLELDALIHLEHLVDDLLRGLTCDLLTTNRAVRRTCAGIKEPEVVVDLGDRAHRRTGVAVGRLLVDGHRRRQTLDEIDIGLVHLTEELTRVCRE